MNNDTLLGFLLALPLYGIILLLFKDIIIHGFLKRLVANSKTEIINTPPNHLFETQEFKDAVESDLLTSYKLLLIIKDQLTFLKRTAKGNTKTEEMLSGMYDEKLDDLQYTLENTEHIFDDMGNTEYKEIKKDLKNLLENKSLF